MDLFDAKRSTKHHNFASSIEQKRAYESATAGLASLPDTNPSARQVHTFSTSSPPRAVSSSF